MQIFAEIHGEILQGRQPVFFLGVQFVLPVDHIDFDACQVGIFDKLPDSSIDPQERADQGQPLSRPLDQFLEEESGSARVQEFRHIRGASYHMVQA